MLSICNSLLCSTLRSIVGDHRIPALRRFGRCHLSETHRRRAFETAAASDLRPRRIWLRGGGQCRRCDSGSATQRVSALRAAGARSAAKRKPTPSAQQCSHTHPWLRGAGRVYNSGSSTHFSVVFLGRRHHIVTFVWAASASEAEKAGNDAPLAAKRLVGGIHGGPRTVGDAPLLVHHVSAEPRDVYPPFRVPGETGSRGGSLSRLSPLRSDDLHCL